MQLFYNPELKQSDKKFFFDKNESRHIIKVLRKKKGDKIIITNGLGLLFNAEITFENQTACEVSILSSDYQKPKKNKIHMAVAPTKLNDRFQWFIEKATEIGVDVITPIFCHQSERKILKEERFKKVLIAAAKQSLRPHFPVLQKAISFEKFISQKHFGSQFIAHCQNSPKKPLKTLILSNKDTLVLIGPEGDFSPNEVQMAEDKGFQSVSLAKQRLRTETAAIVACHTIQLFND